MSKNQMVKKIERRYLKQIIVSVLTFVIAVVSISFFPKNVKADTRPTVTTDEILSISDSSAVIKITSVANGGSNIFDAGIKYGTDIQNLNQNASIGALTQKGSFNVSLYGLQSNTVYYCMAYSTNSINTAYGAIISFKTDFLQQVVPTYSPQNPQDDTIIGLSINTIKSHEKLIDYANTIGEITLYCDDVSINFSECHNVKENFVYLRDEDGNYLIKNQSIGLNTSYTIPQNLLQSNIKYIFGVWGKDKFNYDVYEINSQLTFITTPMHDIADTSNIGLINELSQKYNLKDIESSQIPLGVSPVEISPENLENYLNEITTGVNTDKIKQFTKIKSPTLYTGYISENPVYRVKVSAYVSTDKRNNISHVSNPAVNMSGITFGLDLDNINTSSTYSNKTANINATFNIDSYLLVKELVKVYSQVCHVTYSYTIGKGYSNSSWVVD